MSSKNRLSRRDFLRRAGTGAAVASMLPSIVPQSAFGANDRINLAIVGIRSRGGSHIDGFGEMENVRIKTIVDVDENLLPGRVDEIQEKFGYKPETEHDMRRVFDDPDIDAVSFATPNHWHALGAIWAAQAGKHVYVEKPASHNLWEGRQMVNAARANNVLMQVGFQNRSRRNTRAAMEFLHEGGIGEVYMGRGLCYKPRWNIGQYPDGPMPDDAEAFYLRTDGSGEMPAYTRDYLSNVHYDLWMGPAEERPFNPNRFHYNWHWQWEYGNGDTGNQGPHQIDIGRWGLNKEDYPVKVKSSGDYYVFEDSAQNTPNTQTTLFEYEDGTLFEFGTRGLFTPADGDIKIGNVFYGSDGWMEIDSGGNWKTYFGYEGEPGPSSEATDEEEYDPMNLAGAGGGGHFANFIGAMRSGSQEDLTCDIEVGHRSSALAHLGNVSYRLGRELEFDGDEEQFVGDADANSMLRDDYREPYVVPKV